MPLAQASPPLVGARGRPRTRRTWPRARLILGAQGDTGWTPKSATGGGQTIEHWYRSDGPLWQDAGSTPAISDGDPIGRWEDKSANADHTNQAVAWQKPTLQNGAGDLLNGHGVIRFGAADVFTVGAFTTGGALSQPFTVFAVAALDAAAVDDGTSRHMIDSDDLTNRMVMGKHHVPAPDEWAMYGGAGWLDSGVAANSNWNIWTTLFNGASSGMWFNGGIVAVTGNAGSDNPDGITLGNYSLGSQPWDGDIAEILVYDANLSDADKNQVGQYLAVRYGLSYTDI